MTEENKGKKVLVVDDDRAIAQALKLKLEHEGFSTTSAANGEEALGIIGKEKFDLVILDLVMPKIDGFGVLEKLKKSGNKTPVIVASNLSQGEDESRAKALGAKDYFIKSNMPLAEVVKKARGILE